ncbi:transglycosylase domain-containing protein [Thalassospira sp. MCCC 1A02491]|uniref:transglycosylase domain-containing protein n=1 Tax=Thalassospira sp. MCCC 1A02491 TaxID=1769751 RepID=UPI0009EF2844|nr:transglycosylase domain-containing protein [Thalassospira sp. MCCC 1A02491]
MTWLVLKRVTIVFAICTFFGLVGYGGSGWLDARSDSEVLALQADNLIADGFGPEALGSERLKWLLAIEDPDFYGHNGIDVFTAGAGKTTLTQSLAKRLAFDDFRPGIGKIRQTGYALGLEQELTKEQILSLFLKTAEMGNGPNGWMVGFFEASQVLYGYAPGSITRDEFLRLVAVLIAPSRLHLLKPNDELIDRVERIDKLLRNECSPKANKDVWLSECG